MKRSLEKIARFFFFGGGFYRKVSLSMHGSPAQKISLTPGTGSTVGDLGHLDRDLPEVRFVSTIGDHNEALEHSFGKVQG